ncbi:flagellar hook-basal body complex protein FliE [Cellulomonas fengjieae]|uniref:Flagellar hook-basal body complex protein FliE n=1 Tax=Cellulomonas fengjieae TaxID=2819978 RepID=A0ABS3SGR9_9CELL|nr:flagellar hook-basal body complex protein FliE [Cellulomonas fengjieae]MBO3084941.1 flagellar hook-basal body complex protein FliE [Cellulomonas fengjieae]MBO3100688.1 flagellar hook-basal body complex protein FliE [Cellulomonas fengjieae]QVI66457.1 flagellar hook-basal body complex protein FliE [Cellulomonas fengjieae]
MSLPLTAVSAVTPTAFLAPTTAPTASDPTAGAGFASVLGSIDQLQNLQSTSSSLAVQAVTGDLDDVHDYTIAAAEASTAIELTAAIRNKAVEAFSEIMRMQA